MTDEQKRIITEMTTEEKAFLFSAQIFFNWKTGILSDNENRPLTKAVIEMIVDLPEPKFNAAWEALIKKNIIGITKKGIKMDSAYAWKGFTPIRVNPSING